MNGAIILDALRGINYDRCMYRETLRHLRKAEGATAPVNSQAKEPVCAKTLESDAVLRIRRRDNDLRRKDRGGIDSRFFGVTDSEYISGCWRVDDHGAFGTAT